LRFTKLLGVPVMVVGITMLLTATAYANHAQVQAKLDCTSQTEVCFDLTVSTSDFPAEGRDVTVALLGHMKGDADAKHFVPVGQPKTVHLDQNLDNAMIKVCFSDVMTTDFDSFEIVVAAVHPQDFQVNGKAKVTFGPFANNCPAPTPSPTPTPAPTPTPSGAPTPTPTPSANTGAVLASTGGFDFRFPLIGLAILVAGATLFVVSASRGRSTSDR